MTQDDHRNISEATIQARRRKGVRGIPKGDISIQVNPSKVLSQQLCTMTITYLSLAKSNFKGNIIL